jgi:DNA-binding Lrp family transcriptional regulator
MLVSGNYDLQLIIVGDSLQDIAGFVSSKLAPMDGVTSTRTHFMLKKYKEAGFAASDDEAYERLSVAP